MEDIVRVVRCLGEGHRVGFGRLAVPEIRMKAMAEYERPKTKKQQWPFLGSIGYYRQFVPGFAERSWLLTPAIRSFL